MTVRRASIVTLAATLVAASASGQLSDPYISITVSNANGSGNFTANLNDPRIVPQPDGGVVFNSFIPAVPAFPLTINDNSGSPIATIEQLIAPATVDDIQTPGIIDARAGIAFIVRAASLDVDVEVTSTFAQTDTINNAIMRANASYTVTDDGGGTATLSGNGPFATFAYNGDVNTGTVFASLVSGPITTSVGGTESPFDTTGEVALGTAVTSFQFQSVFTLTANDSASGNITLRVVPAPASVLLLGLGGLTAATRRRVR
ncbi:MAG: PEP-CTERM sorting domain-containing protein [Phycisphaerales bacterium]